MHWLHAGVILFFSELFSFSLRAPGVGKKTTPKKGSGAMLDFHLALFLVAVFESLVRG